MNTKLVNIIKSSVVLTCGLVGLLLGDVNAQNPFSQGNNGLNQAQTVVIDTSTSTEEDTIVKNGFFSIFKGKPGKAALLSLVIPSGGQIYNKKWWKVPLALAIDGGLGYVLYNNIRKYNIANDAYINARDLELKTLSRTIVERNFHRKNKEYAYLWLFLGHITTVIDAYVDRHLMKFDVSPDLSLQYGSETNNFFVQSQLPIFNISINLNPQRNQKPNPLFLTNP